MISKIPIWGEKKFKAEKAYMYKDAAKLIFNGSALKKYMSREDYPFIVLYEYGNSNNKQGYWIYKHLALQMEYFLDWLKVMYPYFYFVFIFDHCCGHNQASEFRLKASITRNYFGGKQPNIRDTFILWEDGFLGPYDHILEIDDTQHMWWYPALPDTQLPAPLYLSDINNA